MIFNTQVIDDVIRLPYDEAARLIYKNLLETWLVEVSLIASRSDNPMHRLIVTYGMGLPDQIIPLPDSPQAEYEFLTKMAYARSVIPATWHGLDIRHTHDKDAQHVVRELSAFDICVALLPGIKHLNQSAFDFLTLKDVKDRVLDSKLVNFGDDMFNLFQYDEDDLRLSMAFSLQMIEEAAPFSRHAITGAYVLQHTPLPYLDTQIVYDTIRLLFVPNGIFATIISDNWYVPFFWSPNGINSSRVFFHTRGVFSFEVLMSCIWRDACVVREKWCERQQGKRGYVTPHTKRAAPGSLVLPRTVYYSNWGTDADRESVTDRARSAHAVRGHYRELPDGWTRSEKALEQARENMFPDPPDGYTFVKPYATGLGESKNEQPYRRVICKGLHVASIALGK
jgi:hypothetical protein